MPKISSYCGVERSADVVEKLVEKFPEACFVSCDLDCEPLKIDRQFDCILMVALIEHLFNQRFVMEGVARLLKPGGVIVLTTPTPFGNDVVHRIGSQLGLFAKSAADDHIVLYNRHRFGILADEVDLDLKSHQYFQLFCNQLAILEKPATSER